jgi:hypothetical protein
MKVSMSIALLIGIIATLGPYGTFGQSIVTGPGRYALQFDYSQWVQLPISLSEALGPEFTFECWIQIFIADTRRNPPEGDFGSPSGTKALNRPIVSRYNTSLSELGTPPNNNQNDFLLQINPDGKLVFFVGGATQLGFIMYSEETLEDYRWYHVAFSIEYLNTADFPFRSYMHLDFWTTSVHVGEYQVILLEFIHSFFFGISKYTHPGIAG